MHDMEDNDEESNENNENIELLNRKTNMNASQQTPLENQNMSHKNINSDFKQTNHQNLEGMPLVAHKKQNNNENINNYNNNNINDKNNNDCMANTIQNIKPFEFTNADIENIEQTYKTADKQKQTKNNNITENTMYHQSDKNKNQSIKHNMQKSNFKDNNNQATTQNMNVSLPKMQKGNYTNSGAIQKEQRSDGSNSSNNEDEIITAEFIQQKNMGLFPEYCAKLGIIISSMPALFMIFNVTELFIINVFLLIFYLCAILYVTERTIVKFFQQSHELGAFINENSHENENGVFDGK